MTASTLTTANAADLNSAVLHGDCVEIMRGMQTGSVDFVITDPPYITRYADRSGRTVANDDNHHWLKPAFAQMHRLLKAAAFCVSFYGWNKADLFIEAWRSAGFRIGGHLDRPRRLCANMVSSFAAHRRAVGDRRREARACFDKCGSDHPALSTGRRLRRRCDAQSSRFRDARGSPPPPGCGPGAAHPQRQRPRVVRSASRCATGSPPCAR